MSQLLDPPGADAAAALEVLAAAVDRLQGLLGMADPGPGAETRDEVVGTASAAAAPAAGGAGLWRLGSGELLETAAEVHALGCRLEAALHVLVAEANVCGAAGSVGAVTTGGWLQHRLGLHPGRVKQLLTTARSLHEPGGSLVDHFGDADNNGDFGDAANREGASDGATDSAGTAQSGAHCSDTEDSGRSEHSGERSAPVDGVALLRGLFGAGRVSGEHVAVAMQALDRRRVARPDLAARAAVFLAEQAPLLTPRGLRRVGARLVLLLDPDGGDAAESREARDVLTRELRIKVRDDGTSRLEGRLDAELTAALLAQLEPLAAPRPAADGTKDPRPVGQRQADALAELVRLAASATGGPTRRGSRPTITVTIDFEDLRRRTAAAFSDRSNGQGFWTGAAADRAAADDGDDGSRSARWAGSSDLAGSAGGLLDWAGPLSAAAVRRLACDAKIIPVVLGADGQPLDVGRASYTVTPAIWRGLVARDAGCAFAGCDRPPEWTEAHHNSRHWADGGVTSVETMCLLCDPHHRQVHHHGWQLKLLDGQMWTIPPRWIDPAQTPRPNTGRDIRRDLLHADLRRRNLLPEQRDYGSDGRGDGRGDGNGDPAD